MSIEPKVSVVVATYNQEKTIARTLDSILSQERDFPIEIIIGDDASTDSTERICREYQNNYPEIIRYFRWEKNKGVMDNYYDCLLEARGEYIADVAGDDYWIRKDKLQKQTEILDKEKGVVLVCTDWLYNDEATSELYSPWKDGKYDYDKLFNTPNLSAKLLTHMVPMPVHLCSALYRRDAFLKLYREDEYVFRNKEFKVEDFQLIVLLSTIGKFHFLDLPTLAYSVHPEAMTAENDYRKSFDIYYASMRLTRYLADKLQVRQDYLNDVYLRFIHFLVMQAFHLQDKGRMDLMKAMISDWEINPGEKTKIILSVASYPFIWKISRLIWHKIKNQKQLSDIKSL